ncbi:hypothetical protein QJS04_geneDACA005914 [Acorus gramineus]|uniref:Amino acid transporter transmembrane domain-containing protein n=1 Tax=Acorus gramineus TaxID=55184 RepID=A0AAV9B769_ACOGR|nr:hypothetical protein QJS04_geneDACA005914 [Acorus gramineus]
MVGAGIMSIPATMKVLGVGPALCLIVAVAFLSDVSAEFLMRYTECGTSKSYSYAGIMRESFGRLGSVGLQVCVGITNMGCLIVYLIIIDSLRFTSAISVLLAVVFVVITSAMAIIALSEGKTRSPRLLPHLTKQSSALDLFTAIPIIVTAFTFHFNVHPIRAELSNSSDMTSAVRLSLILCSAIYAAVGLAGYLLFGDATMADILSNFDRGGGSGGSIGPFIADTVRLSYALHLILVFPLINFSLRINVDGLLFPKAQLLSSSPVRFYSITGLLLGFTYLAAIAIPNIWALFQFFGSTSAVCLSLIFPGAIILRDVHGVSKRRDKILAASMIGLAVITSTIAITSNVISLFGK